MQFGDSEGALGRLTIDATPDVDLELFSVDRYLNVHVLGTPKEPALVLLHTIEDFFLFLT